MPRISSNSSPSLRELLGRPAARSALILLFVGFCGALWGLGLARALAESFPDSPTFELGPTLLLALMPALAAVWIGWRLDSRGTGGQDAGPGLGLAFSPLVLVLLYVLWPDVAPHVGSTLLGGSVALAGLLILRETTSASASTSNLIYGRLVAILLVCVTLALYLRTLGPTVGQADSFEFQVVAPTLGVAHPTGYPLYILSGKLFSLLPFGSVAWRVNLTSAVFGVGTALFLFLSVYRLTKRPMVGLVASLAFAVSRVFWSQAVVAEVYTLHNLFVALILLLLLEGVTGKWQHSVGRYEGQPEPGTLNVVDRATRAFNPLFMLALFVGLSLANHLTTVLLVPAVALALLFLRPRVGRRQWLVAGGLFFLGLTLYLYIYLRWPALHNGVWMSPGEFWRYVTGQQFSGAFRLDAWRTDPTRYEIVGRLLREPFGWPGLILGIVGLVWLATKNRRAAAITLVTFLAFVWYALSYYVADISVFLLPAHLVLAIWLGLGMAAILSASGLISARWNVDGEVQSTANRWAAVVLTLLFALLPLRLLWTNLPLVDQSAEWDAYSWGDWVLDLPLADNAAILADSARIAPLYYLQRIEGRRPDLDLLVLADEATYRAELEARLAAGQTVYLARYLPGLEGRYHLRSLGLLTEVATAPENEPPPLDRSLGVRFGPTPAGRSIALLGFTGPVSGIGGGVGLTLFWQADAPIDELYHVRLRLVDDAGQVWWQEEGRHAANNYYPTLAWHPGEVVADYHEIPLSTIAPDAVPTGYTVQVGLVHPYSDEGILAQNGEDWFPLTDLKPSVATVTPTPDNVVRARFSNASEARWPWRDGGGGLALVGVDIPDVVAAGSAIELQLYTDTTDAASSVNEFGNGAFQGRPVLSWIDSYGNQVEAPIVDSWGWSRLLLGAPGSPGEYELRLGFEDKQGRFLLAQCGWLAQPKDGCTLASVRVSEAVSGALANFDGELLLLDAEFDLPMLANGTFSPLSAGTRIPVTLHWQALRSMDADYTVSVQLVGPDGRLYGQTDTWPVQGTLPTSHWSPGQYVVDPYEVVLAPDAPPGRYQLGVVVYLLATQARLAVVNESGQPQGDMARVGELQVAPK